MDEGDAARSAARQTAVERRAGRHAEAVAMQRGAVSLAERSGDAVLHAHALRHLADILSDSGDADAAMPIFSRVLAFYATERAPALDAANAVRGAALNAERLGDRHEAKRLWAMARDQYSALDALFAQLTGETANPGLAEAEQHLAALRG